jgi:hypothetical protein
LHREVSEVALFGTAGHRSDAATGTGILYGGFNGVVAFADTWAWTVGAWTQLSPAASPGPVTSAWDAAYDAASEQVILFGGGMTDHTNSGDTWDWNGTTWTLLDPATAPMGRGVGSMTFNIVSGQVVLFGGQGPHQDTYPTTVRRWNGSTWGHGGSS